LSRPVLKAGRGKGERVKETVPGLVLVRGAGDLATGVIVRLFRAGFRVAALETERPSAIRRTVSLAQAMYDGRAEVEGVVGVRAADADEALAALASGAVPVLADPGCACLARFRPEVLVDAILAKRNLGTALGMAPTVVALGPGFEAGVDAHAVIETNRGHDLGRVLTSGSAEPDTGIPGAIGGYGAERVLKAPDAGRVEPLCSIGDSRRRGEPIFAVAGGTRIVVPSPFDGIVRGMIYPGYPARPGLKVADVDPRCRREHCFSVSDKARAVGGGVLEFILSRGVRPE